MSNSPYYYKEGGGVTFYNEKTDEVICHTFRDRGLILREAYPSPPVAKITMIDIPGRDGSIDLTDALGVHFEDRFLYITLTDLDYKLSVGEAFARLQRETLTVIPSMMRIIHGSGIRLIS